MRKSLLTLVAAGFILGTTNAQTITGSNQMASAGDTITYAMVDMCEDVAGRFTFFNPEGWGDDSVSMKWDFRKGNSYADQMTIFIDVDSTPFNAEFPISTHALFFDGKGGQNSSCVAGNVSESDGYEIYRYSGDTINRMAFTKTSNSTMWFMDGNGFPRYIFPFTVGDSWSSSYTGRSESIGAGEDSVLVDDGLFEAEVVGSGSLVLPSIDGVSEGEQFEDIVCVKIKEHFVVNAYATAQDSSVLIIPQLILDEDYYAWFKEGVQEPIAIYYKTINDLSGIGGNKDSLNVFKYQAMDGADPTFASTYEDINTVFKVYPNPNNGQFNIDMGDQLTGDEAIVVYDAMGRFVKNISVHGHQTGQIPVDLHDVPKGLYMLNVRSGSRSATEKVFVH